MTRRSRGRLSVVGVGLVLLAAVVCVHGAWQSAPAWITDDEQARLVERLRSALPSGSTITPIGLGRAPDEWRSLDLRTFEVSGTHDGHPFRVWFLPLDWIGIRLPDPKRTQMVYWEGVSMDRRYKSITFADDVSIYEAVRAMGMNNTASLVNSGWSSGIDVFGKRLKDVDAHTLDLVHRFCDTQECKDEAADSLIVLGVPARTLTLECAERAAGRPQEYCVSALGYWGDPDSVRVLASVVTSPVTSARARKYAAFSLSRIADPASGPALRQALQATSSTDRDVATGIVAAIGRIRYKPAAPDILAFLLTELDRDAQAVYIEALAALQYAPAAPAIARLSETKDVSAEWLAVQISRQRDLSALPELALLRITAPWGQPVRGIRLLLVGPESASVSGRMQAASVVENVGDTALEVLGTPGVWIVDGQEYRNLESVKLDGFMTLPVNDVTVRSVDLSKAISTPGAHSVQYRLLGATSNPLTLKVQ